MATTPTPKAAAIYARLSLDRHGDGLGVERQAQLCEGLAAERGWPVAETYVDNSISATNGAHRPAYDRLLADLESGARDAVLCVDIDRLARRPIDLEHFMLVADAKGVALANVSGDTDLGSSDGRLKARIMGAVARQESEKKGERMVRKFAQDARLGVPASGPRPFGYKADRITADPAEAKLIREMARRMVEGETAADVARDLNGRGVPAPKARAWTATTVAKIVRSPRVAGLRAYRGEIVGDGRQARILDRSTWEHLNARIRRTSRPGRPTAFLLAGGLARCGVCGTALWSSWANGKPRYVCSSRTGADGCGAVAIGARPFEALVAEAAVEAIAGPKFRKALQSAGGGGAARRKAERDLADAEERKREMAGDHADGTIGRGEWLEARARLDVRISAASKILAAGSGPLGDLPGDAKALADLWETSPPAWRRAVLDLVADRIDVARSARTGGRFDPARVSIRWKA